MTRTLMAIGLAAAMAMALPAPAAAQEEETAATTSGAGAERRLYGTLGGLWAVDAFDTPSLANTQNSYGLDTRVGYRLTGIFAAEVQYQWAARYEITQGGAEIGKVETHAATANVKAGLLESALQPYLLFGVGIVNAQLNPGNDATEFGLRVGGGLQWFVTEHVGLYGELTYLQPFGPLKDFAAVPIAFGAAFRY
jgi:opacity protein-like surface antigen